MSSPSEIPALAQRQEERADLLDAARAWAADLDDGLGVVSVVVFGSVARGDFNVWSDLDILVIAEHLPEAWEERVGLLATNRPPRLAPVGWTPDEFRREHERHNPIAAEAVRVGVVVRGDDPGRLLVVD